MSEARELHEEGGCCSCHLNPPCGFCLSMTEEERDVYGADGIEGLLALWEAEDDDG
jgi:hypothetical protein